LWVSELLDRIHREIRERLEASRAAVLEHERLEAALHALGDAGSRKRSPRPAAAATAKRGARARAGRASAKTRDAAGAVVDGGGRRAGRSGNGAASAGRAKGRVARAAGPARAGKRAPRGANRAAVLRVTGERPGVTAPELAAASGVTGGTLYSLLRTLTERGTLEKRELPGGQTGYTVVASADGANSTGVAAGTATNKRAVAEPGSAA
jgi:IclR helix-turn-helix domain